MSAIAKHIDQQRARAARLAGLDLEYAMSKGDRETAYEALREMNAQTTARQAARQAGCYFVEQGDANRAALEPRNA